MQPSISVRCALAVAAVALGVAACGGGQGGSTAGLNATASQLAAGQGTNIVNRDTTQGPVAGVQLDAGVIAWKGIPYAQPPVGDLRWKAPVPATWSQRLAADKFGPACLQNGRIYGPGLNNTYDATIAATLNTPVGSEDCLSLNIWSPRSGQGAGTLPVVFFVYGGSDISGYSADPVYDGATLAKAANVVVVTANYRVGPLGFFNLAQLKGGTNSAEDSGNFALLDLIQALKFVQANAGAFGGDPGNVTLMGQSAGAINVYALMTAPSAKGLFHKAMPLSGGISLASNLPAGSIPTLNPATTYAAQGTLLLAHLLIADGKATDIPSALAFIATQTSEQIAAYMRGKDAKEILSTLLAAGLTGSGPIPDGTFLPANPINAIAAGNYSKVPVLAGNTREEGKLFAPFLPLVGGPTAGFKISDATRFTMMMNFDPNAPTTLTEADILAPAYVPSDTPVTGWTARANLLGAVFLDVAAKNVLDTLKTQQSNVYYYRFDWAQEPAPWNTIYGAAHVFDLPFVFGNFGPSLFSNVIASKANEAGRLQLSSAMMDTVGAFARTGDPNNAHLGVTWQPWPSKVVFDATLTKKSITAR